MKLELKPLVIPASMINVGDDWFEVKAEIKKSAEIFAELAEEVKKIGDSAGDSDALKAAVVRIKKAASGGVDLRTVINSSLYIRALGVAALEFGAKMPLDQQLFDHIDTVRERPSVILLEDLRQYYLIYYDQLVHRDALEQWLLLALQKRNQLDKRDVVILSSEGAKWVANQCIDQNKEFTDIVSSLGLDKYKTGRFITVAQQIYFVERLKEIPVNQPHHLLDEVQNKSVYDTQYGEQGLLGHEILKTLISRAPVSDIHDSWRNVVMQIAGDPRVSKSNSRYQKWWLHLDQTLIQKVIGWLSHLDLKLFLEALEDYSGLSGNEELLRMYPARKRFLEGLLDQKLVTGTRLYLTSNFKNYLKRNYKKEYLPELYTVSTNDISVIHVQLGKVQLIEGSHRCKLWVYRALLQKAVVFNYTKRSVSYPQLTSELSQDMYDEHGRHLLVDNITHYPPLLWQKKAIEAMTIAGVSVNPEQVLTAADYLQFKRKYGVIL